MARAGEKIQAKAAPQKRQINAARRAEIGQEKRARTRTQIMEATFALLGRERGLFTRIEEICSAANVSRGTFYNHFQSQEDLFDALSYELSHSYNVAVMDIVNQMPAYAQRVASAIRYYLDRAQHDPKWGWAMVNMSMNGGMIFGAGTFREAMKSVVEGMAAGEFNAEVANSGRDLVLGTGLAAMNTILRSPPSTNYSIWIAKHILRGLGVADEIVETAVHMDLPDPEA